MRIAIYLFYRPFFDSCFHRQVQFELFLRQTKHRNVFVCISQYLISIVHVTDSVKFLEKRLRTKRKVKKDAKVNRQRLKLAEISAKISNYDVNSRHCKVIEDTQDIMLDSNFRKLQNRNSSKTRVRKGQKFIRAVCVTLSGMVQGPLRGSRGKFARVDDLLAVRTISSKGASRFVKRRGLLPIIGSLCRYQSRSRARFCSKSCYESS